MKSKPTKVPTKVSLHIKLSQLEQQRYQKKLYGLLHIDKELPMLKCYVPLIQLIVFSHLLLFTSLTNIDIRLSLANMDKLRKLEKNCTHNIYKNAWKFTMFNWRKKRCYFFSKVHNMKNIIGGKWANYLLHIALVARQRRKRMDDGMLK